LNLAFKYSQKYVGSILESCPKEDPKVNVPPQNYRFLGHPLYGQNLKRNTYLTPSQKCRCDLGFWSFTFLNTHKTLPKAQRTRGLSSAYQSNFFRSYHKFLHKSWSNIFRISTKHQLQNLNQTSAFRQNLNLKIFTKPSFRISTKVELHNHNQASYQ